MATLVWSASGRVLTAVFRIVAITGGALPVRMVGRSSSNVTSRTQWRRFSMAQCTRIQAATCDGVAETIGIEVIR
ncbi:hypothetical protein A6F59_25435 [Prescottella equi]|nr:hypothetical protein A6F59_25435 [Prescottella equi]